MKHRLALVWVLVVGSAWSAELTEVKLLDPSLADGDAVTITRNAFGQMVFKDKSTSTSLTLQDLRSSGTAAVASAGGVGAIQWNDNGALGSDAELVWDNLAKRLYARHVFLNSGGILSIDGFNSWNAAIGLVASAIQSAGAIKGLTFEPIDGLSDFRTNVAAGRRHIFQAGGEAVVTLDATGTIQAQGIHLTDGDLYLLNSTGEPSYLQIGGKDSIVLDARMDQLDGTTLLRIGDDDPDGRLDVTYDTDFTTQVEFLHETDFFDTVTFHDGAASHDGVIVKDSTGAITLLSLDQDPDGDGEIKICNALGTPRITLNGEGFGAISTAGDVTAGSLRVNTTRTSATVNVGGALDATGNIYGAAFVVASDESLKDILGEAWTTATLETMEAVLSMAPIQYRLRNEPATAPVRLGWRAQDMPAAVRRRLPDGHWGIDHGALLTCYGKALRLLMERARLERQRERDQSDELDALKAWARGRGYGG